jgi:hypothetical protein
MPPTQQKCTPKHAPIWIWLSQYLIGRKKTKAADFSAAYLDSLDCIGFLGIETW